MEFEAASAVCTACEAVEFPATAGAGSADNTGANATSDSTKSASCIQNIYKFHLMWFQLDVWLWHWNSSTHLACISHGPHWRRTFSETHPHPAHKSVTAATNTHLPKPKYPNSCRLKIDANFTPHHAVGRCVGVYCPQRGSTPSISSASVVHCTRGTMLQWTLTILAKAQALKFTKLS